MGGQPEGTSPIGTVPHTKQCNSVLAPIPRCSSLGHPAISANHREQRRRRRRRRRVGWGEGGRDFLPNPFMPFRPPAVPVKRIESGWARVSE